MHTYLLATFVITKNVPTIFLDDYVFFFLLIMFLDFLISNMIISVSFVVACKPSKPMLHSTARGSLGLDLVGESNYKDATLTLKKVLKYLVRFPILRFSLEIYTIYFSGSRTYGAPLHGLVHVQNHL